MNKFILTAIASLAGIVNLYAQNADPELKAMTRPLSPEESMKTMKIQDGFKLELVASEPMINEPVLCVWDGNGRMYVAQMETYMQTPDAQGESDPKSRVMLLEDINGDGQMDKSTVFADKLILPRMILPLDDRIIIGTTNTSELKSYRDTNGDGKADEIKVWLPGDAERGNMEHQPSGLIWNMDNNIYRTYKSGKYRFTRGKIEKFKSFTGPSQWGMDHDDRGRVIAGSAGGEKSFQNFQQPWRYGHLTLKDELAEGFMTVWPIDNIPDTQGGRRRFRKESNTLNHFTAGCGHSVYRDTLISELNGDLFMCEPVGRLIRRAKVELRDGKRILHNPYKEAEFISSTDANFRPVNTKMGPDGCLYIVDMYRGIIQQGNFARKGSYLWKINEKYGLDKNIGRGRIYRLVPKTGKPHAKRPQMLNENSKQLLAHFKHSNGWWRDTARKLIILKGDKSIVPDLEKIARDESYPGLGRVAAIWTLEGLNSLKIDTVKAVLKSKDLEAQIAAAQAGEMYLTKNDGDILKDYAEASLKSNSEEMKTQVFLSINSFAGKYKGKYIDKILADAKPGSARTQYAQSYFDRIKKEKAEGLRLEKIKQENALLAASFEKGKKHYKTLCFACHADNGKGTPMAGTSTTLGAPLNASKRVLGNKERLIAIALNGLQGPINGKTYSGAMASIASQPDEYIADILNYIRNEWGNKAPLIKVEDVTAMRSATKARENPWTLEELNKKFGHFDKDRHLWNLASSDKKGNLKIVVDGNNNSRWSSKANQKIGMWVSVELDGAAKVSGFEINGDSNPVQLAVEVSKDGKSWTKIQSSNKARGKNLMVKFKETTEARFFKFIVVKEKHKRHWSINEINLNWAH